MSFRFQRRMNYGSGIGLNLSKSGASPSARTRFGAIGARGFTIRTGIPGFYFRKSWGKDGTGAVIGLIFMLAIATINLTVFLVSLGFSLFAWSCKALWLLFAVVFNVLMWTILTTYDYIKYLNEKMNPNQKVEPTRETPVDEAKV